MNNEKKLKGILSNYNIDKISFLKNPVRVFWNKFYILIKKQGEILKLLDFTKKFNFYLAIGTGLALYFRHRISIDFYTENKFKDLWLKFI